MASTNKTPHLGLCQWEATDPFLREDMNGDFARIDEACGDISRKKLFDITVTEAVQSIRLDFSDMTTSDYIQFEIFLDISAEAKNMRVNGGASYTTLFPGGNSTDTRIYAPSGASRLTFTRSGMLHKNDGIYRMEKSNSTYPLYIDIYGENASSKFSVGDRIIVWGVKK